VDGEKSGLNLEKSDPSVSFGADGMILWPAPIQNDHLRPSWRLLRESRETDLRRPLKPSGQIQTLGSHAFGESDHQINGLVVRLG